jgi:hypothetical protein
MPVRNAVTWPPALLRTPPPFRRMPSSPRMVPPLLMVLRMEAFVETPVVPNVDCPSVPVLLSTVLWSMYTGVAETPLQSMTAPVVTQFARAEPLMAKAPHGQQSGDRVACMHAGAAAFSAGAGVLRNRHPCARCGVPK